MSLLPSILDKRSIIAYEAKDIPAYLSKDEVYKILNACTNKRDHLLVNLAWQTGTRISELINLRVQDIDFYNHSIRFITLKKKGKKMKESHRTIPIKSDVVAETSAYILEKGIKGRIFDITRQRAFQIIRDRAKEAGIIKKVHPHSFRHSYAVNLISQGVPLPVVKDLLGHSSVLTTMVYLKIVKQDAERFLSEVEF